MIRITKLTADAAQKMTISLPDGSLVGLVIQYKPMQYGWFIIQLTYGAFEVDGMRICTTPNMLQQFKNQLPFGLACATTDNGEPTQQQDFSSGYASIYLLSAAEVASFASVLSA